MPSRKSKQNGLFSGLAPRRKMEVLGILLMSVASLLLLSIVSHHPSDYGVLQTISPGSYFSVDQSPALRIQNWLGPVGAWVSHLFVYTLFGYMSGVLPLLIILAGWSLFRDKSLAELIWPSVYGIWMMILIGSLLGWFYHVLEVPDSVWSGNTGVALARILQNLTGIGSIVILFILFLVTVLIPLDRDLQKTVDFLKQSWNEKRETVRGWFGSRSSPRVQGPKDPDPSEEVNAPGPSKPERNTDAEGPTIADSFSRNQDAGSHESGETDDELEEILKRSREKEAEQAQIRDAEQKSLDERPDRAVLERSESADSEEDVEISVFVGEGDEEADARELDRKNRDKAKDVPVIKYKFPTMDLLDQPPEKGNQVDMEEIRENKRIILDKLKRHKIEILGINAIVGPTVTLYELEPAPDVKISKIQSYANDLKMATAAHGLRIIAPIPGRAAVGIEVPNSSRETVYIRSVLNTRKFVETDFELPVAFGKTIENEVFMLDLTKMPHLLMAGATGSGKSVGINTIITCLLYKCHPDDLKFVLVDPKKIELSLYRYIQNHFLAVLPGAEEPIVTDTAQVLETLESVCAEMDQRYDLLKMAMVRDIRAYNEKFKSGELEEELGHRHLPYIVVIIDELADLMMTAGKQIEEPIARLAQLARAIGIHLVVATQRPSVNVITGTIKANFPARIAYQVASKVDSRTILDTGGADQLVGRGDMLFTNGGGMTRIQNAFVSTEEVERIATFVGDQKGYKQPFYLPVVKEEAEGIPDPLDEIDELFTAAAKVVILHQQGSVSLLQRKLKIGYNRAGRIIDQLFNAGIVGAYQGSSARDVLIDTEEQLEEIINELGIRS
ncbi:MAG: DNA translocase FtsK [Balneolaceae bacterium]